MVIELQRLYRDGWTDGMIFIQGILLCRSIELRWANNERNVSCVPEEFIKWSSFNIRNSVSVCR
ncbi:MAG: hypothetical protein IPL55_07195 [Saprospiraceae bacterium]|nr:hypothetical protein [Saprospiraceae bacterium]